MVSSDRKFANAVGAKSARACDNCVRKRARWYCAADDAFLCQSCDSSVHSANPLARRHERVRVKTAPYSMPSWHQGFTRKPRTPRQKKHFISNSLHLVPEISGEENSNEENEEQLLYRVPIFDPELCTSVNSSEVLNTIQNDESKPVPGFSHETGHVHGFLSSEMDLAEFAADVESLLGFEDESFVMEGLGILDCDHEKVKSQRLLKAEVGQVVNKEVDAEFLDFGKESNFELNFDYDSPTEDDNKVQTLEHNFGDSNKDKKIFLRLDYEGVISAWDDDKSPWTTGERPVLNSDDCWPDCMGTCGTMHVYGGEMGMVYGHGAAATTTTGDGGREARVSRYREKRRRRLFSKKIRYEVRKLNAEKRPRMKGRFVKRANFVAPAFA